jgi:hypothetical protein
VLTRGAEKEDFEIRIFLFLKVSNSYQNTTCSVSTQNRTPDIVSA